MEGKVPEAVTLRRLSNQKKLINLLGDFFKDSSDVDLIDACWPLINIRRYGVLEVAIDHISKKVTYYSHSQNEIYAGLEDELKRLTGKDFKTAYAGMASGRFVGECLAGVLLSLTINPIHYPVQEDEKGII